MIPPVDIMVRAGSMVVGLLLVREGVPALRGKPTRLMRQPGQWRTVEGLGARVIGVVTIVGALLCFAVALVGLSYL